MSSICVNLWFPIFGFIAGAITPYFVYFSFLAEARKAQRPRRGILLFLFFQHDCGGNGYPLEGSYWFQAPGGGQRPVAIYRLFRLRPQRGPTTGSKGCPNKNRPLEGGDERFPLFYDSWPPPGAVFFDYFPATGRCPPRGGLILRCWT